MQYVKELVFLQGEDTDEFFRVLYPKGMVFEPRRALEYMLEYADGDEGRPVTRLTPNGFSGVLNTKHHVLQWNYAYRWIALYLKVTKKELRAQGWKETRELVNHG